MAERYAATDWIVFIALCIFFVLSIFLNALVFHIIRLKNLKTMTFKLIANQTLSEILYCALSLSIYFFCSDPVVRYSRVLAIHCAFVSGIKDSMLSVSVFSMVVIAYERYRKLYRPMSSELNFKLWISMIWLLAMGFSPINIINNGYTIFFRKNGLFGCMVILSIDSTFFARGYNLFVTFTLINILSLVITAFLYYKVIVKVRQRKLVGNTAAEDQSEKLKKNKRRTMEMLTTLIAWYFIFSLPIYGIVVFGYITESMTADQRCTEDFKYGAATVLSFTLFCFGSIFVNPLIIFYYNPDFKFEAFRILRFTRFSRQLRGDTELESMETGSS